MDFDNYELDENMTTDSILEMMDRLLGNMYKRHMELRTLLDKITETNKYINALSKYFTELPFGDQIQFSRVLAECGEMAKKLCEKNHIDIEKT